MKTRELREKTTEELKKLLLDKKADLVELRFDVGAHQEKNVKKIGQTKKIIARIETILQERRLKKDDSQELSQKKMPDKDSEEKK